MMDVFHRHVYRWEIWALCSDQFKEESKCVFCFIPLAFCLYGSSAFASLPQPGLPGAPHGGKLEAAEPLAKPEPGAEKVYLEVVREGKRLDIYPYFLDAKSSLVPIPRRELKKVIVRLGAPDINTQKTLPSKLRTARIEAVLDEKDPRFNTLIVTVDFKQGKPMQEAKILLGAE